MNKDFFQIKFIIRLGVLTIIVLTILLIRLGGLITNLMLTIRLGGLIRTYVLLLCTVNRYGH